MCVCTLQSMYNAYSREILKCRAQCHHLYVCTFRYRCIRLLVPLYLWVITCWPSQRPETPMFGHYSECTQYAGQEMNLFSPQVSLARAKNSLCNAATMQTLISVGPKQQTIEQETKALGIAHFVEGCHVNVASIRNMSA